MKKELLKDLLPPLLIRSIKRSGMLNYGIRWKGSYSGWQEALDHSGGYDAGEILQKVKSSLLTVRDGQAAYERDSVVFDKPQFDWPVLSFLMWVAAQDGFLHVADFGGSLGSTYFQNRPFLKSIKSVSWGIVEQPHFVKCGKENFENDQLRFYDDIESCMASGKINLLILSSVLPYLEKPYELFEKLVKFEIPYVLIDKMPLIEELSDRLTVQHVPPDIYKASYPAWFFSSSRFNEFIEKHFRVLADFDSAIDANIPSVFKGFLLIKK